MCLNGDQLFIIEQSMIIMPISKCYRSHKNIALYDIIIKDKSR